MNLAIRPSGSRGDDRTGWNIPMNARGVTDANTLTDGYADIGSDAHSDNCSGAHSHATGQHGARRDMRAKADAAVMRDDRAGVDNRAEPNFGRGPHIRQGEHLCTCLLYTSRCV